MSLALTPHILVVDDDSRLRGLIARYLSEQGFIVTTAKHAGDARAKLAVLSYDLMVLDVMMPGESGFDLTRALRLADLSLRPLPILLLTARGESADRIEGLESGADDYLMKPFEPRELLLRINAILRRAPKSVTQNDKKLSLGSWMYHPERDELRSVNEVVTLSGMEAGLMRLLAAAPGQVMSRETLAERSSAGQSVRVNARTIDVQVTRLRRKIEADVKNPRYLVTIRGEGYSLRPDAE